MVPTDCEFGPDGAFYWSDWIGGWDKTGAGRIFKVTDPAAMKDPRVAEANTLIAEGLGKKTNADLMKLLEFGTMPDADHGFELSDQCRLDTAQDPNGEMILGPHRAPEA